MTYNPEKAPPPAEWLALDESEQITRGERAIVESLARPCSQDLSRGDAIDAIGSLPAEYMSMLSFGP